MKNKKITALLTSVAMMFSLSTAALTSHAEETAPTAAASSENEVRHCEMCGAELAEGTLPTPLGIYVCPECRKSGAGGTTIPSMTTTTTVTTTGDVTGTGLLPTPNENMFSFDVMLYDDNSSIHNVRGIEITVEYEDGTKNTFNYGGIGTWIEKKGMNGKIYISKAPEGYEIDDTISMKEFPADLHSIVLYLKKAAPVVTTPIEGEELGIYVYDIDTNEFVGGAKMEIYYDDYSTETFDSLSDNPVIHKHDGRMGTITVLSVPDGYKLVSSEEYNFIETSQFAVFFVKKIDAGSTTTTFCTTTTTITSAPEYTTTTYIRSSPYSSVNVTTSYAITPGETVYVNYDTFMVSWIKLKSDNAFIVPEKSAFEVANNESGSFAIECLNGAVEGTGTITLTYNNWLTGETAEKEITFTIGASSDITTCTTTTTFPGQFHKVADISNEIVLAVDETGIEFENSGYFPMTPYAASILDNLEPGMKVNVRILYDTSASDRIMTASNLCIVEENCTVERTMAGDANCDGDLNLADGVLIMQAVTNPDKYGIGLTTGINLRGEANGDLDGGGVTQRDALIIQQFKLGMICDFPGHTPLADT